MVSTGREARGRSARQLLAGEGGRVTGCAGLQYLFAPSQANLRSQGLTAGRHSNTPGDIMAALGHVAGLAGGPEPCALGGEEGAMLRSLPHLPLRVVGPHVALGAHARIADDG